MVSFVKVKILIMKEIWKKSPWIDFNPNELYMLEKSFPSQFQEAGPAFLGEPVINPPLMRESKFSSCPIPLLLAPSPCQVPQYLEWN